MMNASQAIRRTDSTGMPTPVSSVGLASVT
jgi:hypothetical protein